ncbi:hypothetical protein DY468_17000 [Rhodopseudomonas sp. BR0M22]|nr:hypothetical protein [Rhodopseudomonas sp. BR0M22]
MLAARHRSRRSSSAASRNHARHCEERSDEAIQGSVHGAPGLLRYARNDGVLVRGETDERLKGRGAARFGKEKAA